MKPRGFLFALLPVLAGGQDVRISGVEESPGTVVGRVCVDENGDGLCGSGEPGIAGSRLLLDGGQVALADQEGRFHFSAVPARLLLPGRSAYGGHALTMEGTRTRTLFELAPGGAARADLAIPSPPLPAPPPLLPPARAPSVGPQQEGERLRWNFTGRATPGSRIEVDGRAASVEPDGTFSIELFLARGKNSLGLAVALPDGRLALYRQVIHWVERREWGDQVNPLPAQILALVALPREGEPAGAGFVARGVLTRGVALQLGSKREVIPMSSGSFAQWVPLTAGAQTLEIEGVDQELRVRITWRLGGGIARGAAVGLADLELSFLGQGGLLFTGRGAAAARGSYGILEGEAGVDLDDRDRSLASLLHPRDWAALEHQLDPARAFVTLGDGSAEDDPNAARGRLYAHLTAGPARLDLGRLRPGQTGAELGRYDRALFGAKLSAGKDFGPLRVDATAFGTTLRAEPGQPAPPRPAHDVLTATGGSLFFLRRALLVAGSEALRVEWRDPFTGLPVAQRTLVRGIDYQIDYVSGWVLLARPLATATPAGALVTGDPLLASRAVLLADYSYLGDGPSADDARGGRVAVSVGPLRLQGAVSSEDRPGGGYRLLSGDAHLDLGPALVFEAQVAQSRNSPFSRAGSIDWSRSDDGGMLFAEPEPETISGQSPRMAFHVEARGEAGGAGYSAWWRLRPRGYSDSAHLEEQDARESGALAGWKGKDLEVSALYTEQRGTDSRDPSGRTPFGAKTARGRVSYQLTPVRLTAEALRESSSGPSESGDQVSAGLRADWKVAEWLTLDASHHQSLARNGTGSASVDNTLSAIGATLAEQGSALSVRAGWGPVLGPRLLLGGERQTDGDTIYGTYTIDPDAPSILRESVSTMGARRREGAAEIFTEEQFARDFFGLRASRVAGAAVEPVAGLRLSANAESGTRLRLDGSQVGRTAAGATASLVRGPVRLSARGEQRWEGRDRQTVAGVSGEWQAIEHVTIGARSSWTRALSASGDAVLFQASVGAAYRGDVVTLLGNLAAIREQRPGAVGRDTGLASLATTVDVTRSIAIGLGANLGLTRTVGARADLLSGSGRVLWRFLEPFDAAIEYARRGSIGGAQPEELHAVRLESGWSMAYGRLSAGYNLFGFTGTGVDPAEADRGRAYIRAEVMY